MEDLTELLYLDEITLQPVPYFSAKKSYIFHTKNTAF
jgi:hypothetical protein